MMTQIVSILVLLLVGYLFFREFMRNTRIEKKNNLRVLYDKLEVSFLQENKVLNNNTLQFLESYKITAELTELLDIQVLWAMHHISRSSVHNTKTDFDKVRDSLSDNSKRIIEEFDEEATSLIKLSYIKFDFLLWIFQKWIDNRSKRIVQPISKFLQELQEEANEIILCGKIKSMKYC